MNLTVIGLNYAPEPTGIAPYTTALAEALAADGHAVRVITGHPHYPEWRVRPGYGQRGRVDRFGGVEVQRIRHALPPTRHAIARAWSEITFGVGAATSGWRRPDALVLVSPALLASAIVQARARAAGIPVIAWVQDLYASGVAETGAGGGAAVRGVGMLEARFLRRADAVAVIHDRFADAVVAMHRVPRERVAVIRNWAHLAERPGVDAAAARARLGWPAGERVVLHAGNMGAKQGLENVVEAARLADAADAPVRFVLLGDGNRRAELERAAHGIHRLEFRDPLPDVEFRAALAAADVLLVNELPSLTESAVPSKLTSYFASGRPVIAAVSPAGTTAAELQAAGAGVRVDAGSPAELLGAVLALDPETAARHGEAGRAYAARALGRDAALAGFRELLQATARPRRRAMPVPTG
ncbi:glycosyltransferase [Agromyces archimandritae]|uniref:D-inositol 3-phosphate glycosyltransferase n=1 Tax=Agromyces archimandritae TaxID=2781962 RepID=A0A975FNH5_9MICO|nr:glycosyltransferase [Agromyces archimandritae]QTX05425.1 glycosyltransferase [Agromyces archimandritae]